MRTARVLTLMLVACGPDLRSPPPAGGTSGGAEQQQKQPLNLTGTYRCTIEGVDTTVWCGGPVYRTDLRSSNSPMTIAQTGTTLQIGAFGVTLDGSLWNETSVSATFTDTKCYSCSFSDPVVIDLRAAAGPGQLRDLRITVSQTGQGAGDCEKAYKGVCAKEGQ